MFLVDVLLDFKDMSSLISHNLLQNLLFKFIRGFLTLSQSICHSMSEFLLIKCVSMWLASADCLIMANHLVPMSCWFLLLRHPSILSFCRKQYIFIWKCNVSGFLHLSSLGGGQQRTELLLNMTWLIRASWRPCQVTPYISNSNQIWLLV